MCLRKLNAIQSLQEVRTHHCPVHGSLLGAWCPLKPCTTFLQVCEAVLQVAPTMVPATAVAALGIVSTRWQASEHVNAIPGMVDGRDNGRALVDSALETLVLRIASKGEQASDDVGLESISDEW